MNLRTDQWAYRLVLLIQIFVPIVYIIGSFFVPESPRWLIGNGRYADAEKELKVLRKDTSTLGPGWNVLGSPSFWYNPDEDDTENQLGAPTCGEP
ncbi:Major facilitator superfamily domain general substrate transporter [Penicillium longicatenatum]|uniref:Major facilitator superfamily domain general substrate transporter n=1 Tax=Penicillium longicatenatum TaxID=1561947 RepID=UPI00254691F9|nr:Major facilitator superfamily domain general substrate transporter [Penicillium longicatenatum]KAJ5657139.1 Major facilitator superfamily domain general substrate transporter [Penicillium longicatenatum]